MTILKPTPGNTIAKIDEMIDVINAGGGGGGGSVDDYIFMVAPVAAFPAQAAYTKRTLDPLGFGGGFGAEVVRGTSISWSVANADRLTINDTGVYDIVVATAWTPDGANVASVGGSFKINGAAAPAFQDVVFTQSVLTNPTVPTLSIAVATAVNGRHFTAGDYIEPVVTQSGDAGNGTANVYLAVSVTRRV